MDGQPLRCVGKSRGQRRKLRACWKRLRLGIGMYALLVCCAEPGPLYNTMLWSS